MGYRTVINANNLLYIFAVVLQQSVDGQVVTKCEHPRKSVVRHFPERGVAGRYQRWTGVLVSEEPECPIGGVFLGNCCSLAKRPVGGRRLIRDVVR